MANKHKHKGFVKHLKKWGLNVQQEKGWRHRGRPYNFYPRGILCHHTASGSQTGNFGSLRVVRDGRAGLPGPLSQALLGRNGTVRLIAAGYANHAGTGGPRAGINANTGNTYLYGIEAENNGVGEPWSKKQYTAYVLLCAALMDWFGIKDVNKVFGHKEWTSRKIDPAGINMVKFRRDVKKALNDGPPNARKAKRQKVYLGSVGEQSSEDNKIVSRALVKKGYNVGRGPGWGSRAQNAYDDFAKKNGIKTDCVRPKALRLLGLKPVFGERPVKEGVRIKNIYDPSKPAALKVKKKLKQRGFAHKRLKMDRHWGYWAIKSYSAWQKSLGYRGKDANGHPGRESLKKLGFDKVVK